MRIPRGLARRLCATAPPTFTQIARNPDRTSEIGGRNLVLAPVYGPPFVRDAGGRRYATMADFEKFVKLGHMSKWLHHSGGTVCEPTDVAVNKRHLDMLLAHMTLTDKPFMGSVTEPTRAADSVEMCDILFDAGDGRGLDGRTALVSLININSPLTFDSIMMGALEVYARANQACIVSPVHRRRRDGAGLGGGHADAGAGGGDGGGGLQPAGARGRAGDLRRLRHLDRHELRRADLRDARGRADHLRRGAAGAADEPAVPVARGRSAARSCRTRRRPTRRRTR